MTGNRHAAVAVAASLILIMACERGPQPVVPGAPAEAVVVYASYDDRSYLPTLVDEYTKQTGVVIIVRHAEAADIVDDVIGNRVSPPADVLWTPSVSGIWRSAEEGALRPLHSQRIEDNVPAWLRDPDNYWVGVSYRTAVLIYDPDAISANDLDNYALLAEPRYRDKLCLASHESSISRAVIAMLIDALDVRPAEIVVRGWIANLAQPVFDSESDLLDAVESGACSIAVVSSTAAATAIAAETAISVYVPAPVYADIEGVGVARHARNSRGAAAFVEWLSTTATQTRHSEQTLNYPASAAAAPAAVLGFAGRNTVPDRNVSRVAWHENEAIKLAERARYR